MVIPGPALAIIVKKDGRYLPILANDCGASAAYVFYGTNMQHTTTPPRIRHCSLTYLGENAQTQTFSWDKNAPLPLAAYFQS